MRLLSTPTSDASPLALGSVLEDVDGNYCLYISLMSYYVSKMCFLINAPKPYLCITALYHSRIPVHRQRRNKVRDTDCHDYSRTCPCQLICFPSYTAAYNETHQGVIFTLKTEEKKTNGVWRHGSIGEVLTA